MFFTHNGVRLSPPASIPGGKWAEGAWVTAQAEPLLPTLGLGCEDRKGGEVVRLNFGGDGAQPFAYRLDAHQPQPSSNPLP